MARHIDFDAAWSAMDHPEPPTVHVGGEDVTLASYRPIVLAMLVEDLLDERQVPWDEVHRALRITLAGEPFDEQLGRDRFDRLIEQGFTNKMLLGLAVQLGGAWVPEPATDEPAPVEAPAS